MSRSPSRIVRLVLLAAGGIAAAAVAYIAFVFDPNDWRPEIERMVRDRTGRMLALNGDIHFSLFPPRVMLGRATLSEVASVRQFAGIDNARITLDILPLLSGRLGIAGVDLAGLQARLVRFRDGRTNVDDLIALDRSAGTLEFVPGELNVASSVLELHDEASGARLSLSDIEARYAYRGAGRPGQATFRLRARDEVSGVDAALSGKAAITVDPGYFAITEIDARATGSSTGWSSFLVQATGSVSSRAEDGRIVVTGLAASLNGVRGESRVHATLDVPAIVAGAGRIRADRVEIKGGIRGRAGEMDWIVAAPRVEGASTELAVPEMTGNLDYSGTDFGVRALFRASAVGNPASGLVRLEPLDVRVRLDGAARSGAMLEANVAGAATVDRARGAVEAALAGRLDEGRLSAVLSATSKPAFRVTVEADIDRMDLDRYWGAGKAGSLRKQGAMIDLSAAVAVPVTGSVRVGSLVIAGVQATDVRLRIGSSAETPRKGRAATGILN